MNKKYIAIISLMLCLSLLFSSCENDTDTTTEPDIITEAPVNNSPENEEPQAPQEDPSEDTTTEEPSEEETTLIGTVTGYTSKGFVITEKDGITYVDGVLIANKTYALPSDYNPGELLSECESAFSSLQAAAANENLTIWNASGFRSYELQESLYTRYSNRDGKEAADRYSARPGHSEHQSGLAIDLNDITSAFADTAEGKWIAENCWKYGFILRYPMGKEAQTGYMYEPWHIRYVGVAAAEKIHNSGLCLEEYYGITSVYEDTQEVLSEEETVSEEELELTEAITTEAQSFSEEITSEQNFG